MQLLKVFRKYIQTESNPGSCKNNNITNNKCSYNSPQKLLLIHLPAEIISKIILELLNEWSLLKSMYGTY
jgi:hypothetical protein